MDEQGAACFTWIASSSWPTSVILKGVFQANIFSPQVLNGFYNLLTSFVFQSLVLPRLFSFCLHPSQTFSIGNSLLSILLPRRTAKFTQLIWTVIERQSSEVLQGPKAGKVRIFYTGLPRTIKRQLDRCLVTSSLPDYRTNPSVKLQSAPRTQVRPFMGNHFW